MQIRAAENVRPGGFGMATTRNPVDEVVYEQRGNAVIPIEYCE